MYKQTIEALHSVVGRAAATFRDNPVDVLAWIFYVASFAMDAVLGVDLELFPFTIFSWHVFVYS